MPATPLPISPTPLPLPGAWRWHVATDDVDVHAGAQPDWHQRYEQLSGGAFRGLVHHVQLPGLRLVREDCDQALHQRGDLGQGAYGFAMPLVMSGPAIFNGQRVEGGGVGEAPAVAAEAEVAGRIASAAAAGAAPGAARAAAGPGADAILVGRGDELDLITPARFSLIAVVVDGELLNPLWERLYGRPPGRWLEQQLVVSARPAAARAVRALHLQAMAALADDASPVHDGTALLQLRDALLMEWIEALPERVSTDELPGVLQRRRLVNRACELMLAHADEPLSMLAVCRHVGASRRRLETCFQDVLGTSPARYLRAVRLNGVRRELRAGAATVQAAAARWGFFHLGQFAHDYKAQFGELPSATRLNHRQDPP